MTGEMRASVGCLRMGEVDGILWAFRAQLMGVMENVRDLMIKVDKGLYLVMGLGGGQKIDVNSDRFINSRPIHSNGGLL